MTWSRFLTAKGRSDYQQKQNLTSPGNTNSGRNAGLLREFHVSIPILGYFYNKWILYPELDIWKDTEFQCSCSEACVTKPTLMMITPKFKISELHLSNFKISVSLNRIAGV